MKSKYLAMAMMGVMMSEMNFTQEKREQKYNPEPKEPNKKI